MFGKKKGRKAAETKIVRRGPAAEVVGRPTASPLRSPIATVLQARTFEVNNGDFDGFGSPPGRF